MLPIIHIDQLAEELKLERRWIIDHWIKREEAEDTAGPVPYFRDGHNCFFVVKEVEEWARRRSLFGFDSTDIPIDPSD